MNVGYFPAKSAVSQPTRKVRDTNGRRILAKSVSDEWLPETLHGVVSMVSDHGVNSFKINGLIS